MSWMKLFNISGWMTTIILDPLWPIYGGTIIVQAQLYPGLSLDDVEHMMRIICTIRVENVVSKGG